MLRAVGNFATEGLVLIRVRPNVTLHDMLTKGACEYGAYVLAVDALGSVA